MALHIPGIDVVASGREEVRRDSAEWESRKRRAWGDEYSMAERRIAVFFYGLFMDGDVLRENKVIPLNPRRAYVEGYQPRIGRRALPPADG